MVFKRVANFFLNKEEDTSGNKPQYRGKIKLDKDVMKGEEILISGWIKKYRWIAWLGLIAILVVAIELIYTDIKLFI